MENWDTTLPNVDPVQEGADATPCLVMIRGPELGRRIRLDKPETTIGRSPTADVVVALDGVSRAHCRILLKAGRALLRDDGSKNGTWLRGERIAASREISLESGDVLHVGDASFKFLSGRDAEADYHDTVYRMLTEDALTQVKNRRFLTDLLEREVPRELRNPHGLALLLMDVDEFKRINDEAGHVFGDYVLRQIAALIARAMRRGDCLARYGGDEFAVVLTDSTRGGAETFAERLRGEVELERFELDGVQRSVTISIGVAVWTAEIGTPAALLNAADVALYAAKGAGRNRVAS
jgi:diguanylate cyclase (GGDEF)-like protein